MTITHKSLLALAAVALLLHLNASPGHAQNHWVSAYYAGWWQGGQLNPEEIDYSAVTHILHFAMIVNPDGSLAGEGNGLTPGNMINAVNAAKAAGRKILLSVGGSNSDAGYAGATSPRNRPRFIANLIQLMTRYSYDGIDVDWEPIQTQSNYLAFVKELRQAMTNAVPGSQLVTAIMVGTDRNLMARAAPYFDQINLMTYDLSGPWPHWVAWHNTALYDGGVRFPWNGKSVPSTDLAVKDKIEAGVPPMKIGVGIDFYGYRWSGGDGTPTGGITMPGQSWTVAPAVKDNIPYFQLMDTYARFPVHWDKAAEAAFISIERPGNSEDQFISFDDEQTIRSKANYVRKNKLGGVIVFELGGGYRRTLPPGYRDLLLQTVKQEFLGGPPPRRDTTPPVVSFESPAPGTTVSGTVTLTCAATDASGINSVILSVNSEQLGDFLRTPPYAIPFNTWKVPNGTYTIGATAFDAFGNRGVSTITITVANAGQPPVLPPLVVYDESLRSPFVNTSWGAAVNWQSTDQVREGTFAAKLDFYAFGAFDLLNGTWGKEIPIDPAEFESLSFEIFPLKSLDLKVAFYGKHSTTVKVSENRWNTVVVPLVFPEKFSRFYMQSTRGQPVTCYIDNIRFNPRQLSSR